MGFAQTTYTWNSSTAVWTTTAAWTPTRTTPTVNDILVFNSGTTVTPTSVPAQTIGQLLISNNTIVNLQTTPIGDNYPSGVYNVVVTQGDEVKTVLVVKR